IAYPSFYFGVAMFGVFIMSGFMISATDYENVAVGMLGIFSEANVVIGIAVIPQQNARHATLRHAYANNIGLISCLLGVGKNRFQIKWRIGRHDYGVGCNCAAVGSDELFFFVFYCGGARAAINCSASLGYGVCEAG